MQLLIEDDTAERWWNRRVAEGIKERRLNHYYHGSAYDLVPWPVITADKPDLVQVMNWGFSPAPGAEPIALTAVNARSEDVHEVEPFIESAERGHRCLVPVTGFFEHQVFKGQSYPHRIFLKNGKPFTIGGLYHPTTRTFTILTTTPNTLLRKVNNALQRQPVIILDGLQQWWLSKYLTRDEFLVFCKPISSRLMDHYTVSRLITAPGADKNVPEAAEPYDYDELAGVWSRFTSGK